MSNLILHPTNTSQWHALVYEAQAITKLVLTENIESYLVFLLMRFSHTTQLIESVITIDFLECMHLTGTRRTEQFQAVGDKSLLLCGLFPGIVNKRRVGLDYFSEIGQAAYLSASESHEHQLSDLYLQLSHEFSHMQHILQAMRAT